MVKLKLIISIILIAFIKLYSQETSFTHNTAGFSFTAVVIDSSTQEQIQSARVSLVKDGVVVDTKMTNATGRAVFNEINPGTYIIRTFSDGYRPFEDTVSINNMSSKYLISLSELTAQTDEITIVAEREQNVSTVDTKTGNQVFDAKHSHTAPEAGMTQVVQENMAGAVKAPSGEVHINGEHGEFSYYIDGIPIPLDVFGGLNEVVDSKVIDRATFITGGYSAEYGGQIAGIVDIINHVPSGKFHLDFESYLGSYFVLNGTKPFSPGIEVPTGKSSSVSGDTLGGRVGPFRSINSNGQSLSLSDRFGNLGYFISGSRQETDRRIDQPTPTLSNDRGTDYSLYSKFDYLLNKTDYITSNLNYSRTNTQVPFDFQEEGYSPDNQATTNSFQTLSYYHTISEKKDKESNLFIGIFGRQGSLLYTPSPVSPVNFQFQGDSNLYALTEDRSFSTYGIRSKYDIRFSSTIASYVGFNISVTNGKEYFTSRDSTGNPGPSVMTNYKGSDFGVFAQIEWHFLKPLSVDAGLRYDQHIAPDVSLQKQISPRIKLNINLDDMDNAYLYYGRLFIPPNIEGLKTLASNISASNVPTVPEKSDFYEFAFMRNFKFGLQSKLDIFYKYSNPGIDDQTIGASAIKTSVNIAVVKTTGIELSLSYNHPKIPVSAYLNAALIHAYGSGAVTGGFLDVTSDGNATDLDHDQRLSITSGINYQTRNWFVSLNSVYGSGLTNGNPSNITYGTGLFDFNTDAHVTPYIIFNLSGGYTFRLNGKVTLEPSLYITNLFDHSYILKGAYFSAASYGERRNVTLKINLHI